MSFEIQELPDVIKIIALLELAKRGRSPRMVIEERLAHICTGPSCPTYGDLDKALAELGLEGLISVDSGGGVSLTEKGSVLAGEWRNLFVGEEPITEVVAGLTDGSVVSLVVIISSYVTGLDPSHTAFAALLTLSSVALTGFSSFFLGSKTEDLNDMLSLQRLIDFSLSDIPEREERETSRNLASRLFTVLEEDLVGSNLKAALINGLVTFIAGIVPIGLYIFLPRPLGIAFSLAVVGVIAGVFLVRYRSRKTRVPWKVTLAETAIILVIAVAASLLLGRV